MNNSRTMPSEPVQTDSARNASIDGDDRRSPSNEPSGETPMIAKKIVLGAAAAAVLGLATLAGTAGEANATYGHGHYKFYGHGYGYKHYSHNYGYKNFYGHNYYKPYYGHSYGYQSCYKYVSQPYYTDYGVEYRQVLVNSCGYSYGY
jgi:hypothetical protein